MLVIAHRGLLNGPDLNLENRPDTIQKALLKGYDVEIDLQVVNGQPFLGHDAPAYAVNINLLKTERLWIHAKTLEAANFCSNYLNFRNWFFHQNDDCIIINKKFLWTYPRKDIPLYDNSIAVLPELNYTDDEIKAFKCFGICTDYASKFA